MKLIVALLLVGNLGYFIWMIYFYHPAPKAAAVVTPASGVRIRLRQEVVGSGQQQTDLSKILKEPVWQDEKKLLGCPSLGPFKDVFRAKSVLDQLISHNILAEIKAMDRATGEHDYQLLIPPAVSQEAAFRKLRELTLQNIDGHIMTDGSQTLAISLGVFTTKRAALNQQKSIMALGYSSIIVPMPRFGRNFWIFVKEGVPLPLLQKIYHSFLQSKPELKASIEQCPA